MDIDLEEHFLPTPARRQPYPITIREAEVLRTEMITETMIRSTFGGAGTDRFVSQVADEHVMLIFPDVDTGELRIPVPGDDHLDWPEPFPTAREYTVRKDRSDLREIDIDFVGHGHGRLSKGDTSVTGYWRRGVADNHEHLDEDE